jgi:dTDP-4-amino-4,6-dideoxygalactose transaminase
MFRIGKEEIDEVAKVIMSKQLFRLGDQQEGHLQEVHRFEEEWAQKIGTEYALCLSGGGTAALLCCLVGLGIGPGDEVLVSGYTFMASAVAILAAGAIPVIVEIDESLGVDPEDVERKIGPNTKAIMPVHMVGRPSDMDRICEIAKRHNLKVVEDACQADGGSYKGQRLGSIGDAGAFSFNHYKIITCGDGGAMVTNDRTVFERALIYHDGGVTFRPHAKDLTVPIFSGVQLRANEIIGAVLRIQLQRLDGILDDLRRVHRTFLRELEGKPGIRFSRFNDLEGDCGLVASFVFEDEVSARKFSTSEGVGGWLPIDSGRHVYSNWDPILEKRAGSHPTLNPFDMPQNKGLRSDYSVDMCPNTLDILSRTVIVNLNVDWTEEEIQSRIEACERAGRLL